MKKALAIVLILCFTVTAFSACSKRGEASSSSSEESVSSASSSEQSSEISRPTVSEAAANNAQKDEDEIVLLQFEEPKADANIAVVTTNMGEFRIVLYPDQAPKAVENFVRLAQDGYYNGKVFHYVEDGFMIQGGAVNSNGTGSRSVFKNSAGEQEFFEAEPDWDLWHFRGAVSLANTSENLNGSQFVIVQAGDIYGYTEDDLAEAKFPQKVIDKYKDVGGIPHRDGYNTVFGMITDGMDVVDQIAKVETDASGVPLSPVLIESVTIEGPELNYDTAEPAEDENAGASEGSASGEGSE